MATREQLKAGYDYLKVLLDESVLGGYAWDGHPQHFEDEKAFRVAKRGANAILKMVKSKMTKRRAR